MSYSWCSSKHAYDELQQLYKDWDKNAPKLGDCQILVYRRGSSGERKPYARIQIDMGVLFLVAYVTGWADREGVDPADFMYKICEED